jgi:hypothetical protein
MIKQTLTGRQLCAADSLGHPKKPSSAPFSGVPLLLEPTSRGIAGLDDPAPKSWGKQRPPALHPSPSVIHTEHKDV